MLCEFDPSKTVRKYVFSYTVTVYIHVVLINHERSPLFPATPIYIYTFPLSHFVSTFQNLLNVRVRYFHYIWSKKRRTVLLWTVKYKITTKITFIRWYFNVLGHGSYTYKSYSLETFLQHFGFFRVWFCFLFFLFCFPLEFVLCWCVDVLKGVVVVVRFLLYIFCTS